MREYTGSESSKVGGTSEFNVVNVGQQLSLMMFLVM